jgi:hypothetical protein
MGFDPTTPYGAVGGQLVQWSLLIADPGRPRVARGGEAAVIGGRTMRIHSVFSAGILASFLIATAASAEPPGKLISDVLLGNEPNVIPFLPGNQGPQEQQPGTIGDAGGNAGHPNSVEGTGAPGPITCGNNWFGVAQVVGTFTPGVGNPDTTIPGNPDAPGMNVDCGTGGSPPHTP